MKTTYEYINQSSEHSLKIVQITDTHILATENHLLHGIDTSETLRAVIAKINQTESPDIILLTGDLVEELGEKAYYNLLSMLIELKAPVYCIPGNHDDPNIMDKIMNHKNVNSCKLLQGNDWRLVLLDTYNNIKVVIWGHIHQKYSCDEIMCYC